MPIGEIRSRFEIFTSIGFTEHRIKNNTQIGAYIYVEYPTKSQKVFI